MANHNVLEWEDVPQVAMGAMNVVHQEELDIVNQVNAAILADEPTNITRLCGEWLAHTEAHFAKENTMMEKYSFPAYHCHLVEHTGALQGLKEMVDAWNEHEGLDALTIYVEITWPKWYLKHIATMDTVTSVFVKQSIENE